MSAVDRNRDKGVNMFGDIHAFDPFYSDIVGVEGVRSGRRVSGTFRACVFHQGLADPLAEIDAESGKRIITVIIRKSHDDGGWLSGRPQIGDTVRLEDGSTFKVSSTSLPLGSEWSIECREA